MFGGNTPSIADIAAVTGNGNNDGFGGNNGWWVLIILLALYGRNGFGNGDNAGNGNGGGNTTVMYPYYPYMAGMGVGSSYTDSAIQRGFDNQSVINKLNGLENGLCSLGYDQLAQMNQIGQAINTNGYQTRDSISQLGFALQNQANQNENANMQRAFAAQQQLSDCCCKIENMMAQANYNRAADTCAIRTDMANHSRDITDAVNNQGNRIIDYLCQQENQRLRDENMWYKIDASQTRQNNYLENRLAPRAIPSYQVPNPNTGCFGWNNQCCNNVYA